MDLENIHTKYETTNYPDTLPSQERAITYEAKEPTSAMECEAMEPTSIQEEMIQAMDSEEGLNGEATCTSPPSSNQEQWTVRNLPSKDKVDAEFLAVTLRSMDGLVYLVGHFDTSKDCQEYDYLVSYCQIFEDLIDRASNDYVDDGYALLCDIKMKLDWIQSKTNPQYSQGQEPLHLPPTQNEED